jgi:hypothetical protein
LSPYRSEIDAGIEDKNQKLEDKNQALVTHADTRFRG